MPGQTYNAEDSEVGKNFVSKKGNTYHILEELQRDDISCVMGGNQKLRTQQSFCKSFLIALLFS